MVESIYYICLSAPISWDTANLACMHAIRSAAKTLACMIAIHLQLTWWRHQMETFSALLAIFAGNSPTSVNSTNKGQWRGALMFSLICVWINGWVNNREAGDLRRYRAHYDVTAMDTTAMLTNWCLNKWLTLVCGNLDMHCNVYIDYNFINNYSDWP